MTASVARRILLPFFSCINKRKTEGCDRGSEYGSVYNGQDGEGPAPMYEGI